MPLRRYILPLLIIKLSFSQSFDIRYSIITLVSDVYKHKSNHASSYYRASAEDALNAKCMNMRPGGV